MTFIIVGASAGLGRSLAEKFASEKNDLILISSDMRDLIPLKSDLEIRFKVKVIPIELSLKKISVDFTKIIQSLNHISPLEGILFPVGYSDINDVPGLDDTTAIEIFNTNLICVCLIINHFLNSLKERKSVIIGFGSVAAIRGRSRNVTYAASKRGLESFFESLRHHMQNSNVIIQFYVLGYLDTNLSFGGQDQVFFRRIDVKKLSDVVYSNRFRDFGTMAYPKKWKLVKLLLPFIPWKIFKKINF
ncbi:MAG: SDR family NAD(P)-dependent oxidoreductase [Thaumarchaeota archaeon]|nr:SDR family NAD(P)-dependent oxidoreductase [Nitrososphaerota archaeon]